MRKHYLNKTKGFTLIEVIIGMMLLGLMAVCFTSMLNFSVSNTARTGSRQQGMAVANTARERLLADSGNTIGSDNIAGNSFLISAAGSIEKTLIVELDSVDVTGSANRKVEVVGYNRVIEVTDEYGTKVPLVLFTPRGVK